MKFFVSCGEASGDLHLSYLVKSIKNNYDAVEFYGVAGNKSKAVGVNIIQNIDELSIMGFTQALSKYNFLKKKAKEYISFIKNNDIKNVILIDYGGFNLNFLKLLKNEIPEVQVFYYIPPKLWIWGERRIKKLKLADYIMIIFPWEVEFYEKYKINAVYFGNPFVDKYQKVNSIESKILLLPGSRKQEIESVLPIYYDMIKKLPKEKFILKLNSKDDIDFNNENTKLSNLEIVYSETLENVCEKVKVAVAVSGTVTLELALLNIPTIVVYKTSFLNYFIAKYILKVGFISLPNLIMKKELFPELIQKKCNLNNILNFISDASFNLKNMEEDFITLRKKIGGDSVIKKYADFLVRNGK